MEPFEPPKYLTSLIAAINEGAKSAQLGALAYTAIGLFLLATAFSATDEDMLLNHAITISQLGGAAVPVALSFGLAPAVFVAAHLYTLSRYDMLAGNVRRFLTDLPVMVRLGTDQERCRQLLANVEFVNALAMPPGSRASSWLFRWTVVFMLAGFPVAVLLLVQMSSLRLQHEVVNWVHHVCLLVDLVLLVWFFGRQGADGDWSFRTAPMRRKVALCWLPVVIILMDLAWLRVPGPDATTVREDIQDYADYSFSQDPLLRLVLALAVQPVDMVLCKHVAWGCRFLTVANRSLMAKVWDAKTFVELRGGADADDARLAAIQGADLRGRVLRFAVLTGSDLFAADLNEAQLQHAKLDGVTLKRAKLSGARMQGADLREAWLQGADLRGAQLQGAKLSFAQLQGAHLDGAQLQGADMNQAQMQGTTLDGAQLQGADMNGAQLQGAYLRRAQLQGADLHFAQLQGADLLGAQLQGADLQFARLPGADLRQASLWNIVGDRQTQIGLADLRAVDFAAVAGEDSQDRAALAAGVPEAVRAPIDTALTLRVGARVLPRMRTDDGPMLVDSSDAPAFAALQPGQTTTDVGHYDGRLAVFLADTIAPIAPVVAERMAIRALFLLSETDRSSGRDLACRLIAAAYRNLVQLKPETVKRLKDSSGTDCLPPARP